MRLLAEAPGKLRLRLVVTLAVVAGSVILSGCQSLETGPSVWVSVDSEPSGALVTVLDDDPDIRGRTVLGETPVRAELRAGPSGRCRLVVEKRGYLAHELEVVPGVASDPGQQVHAVELEPAPGPSSVDGGSIGEAEVIALIEPEIEVIHRSFKSESVSPEASAAAGQAIAAVVENRLGSSLEARRVSGAQQKDLELKALVRDLKAAQAVVDPIRLAYLTEAPRLETRAGRSGAARVGEVLGAQLVLLVSGRSNTETASMKIGKAGLMAAGTATSFASGYSRALANGDSFFTYNVYLPTSSEGAVLQAILVDCRTGEVLWINRGMYPGIPKSRNPVLEQIVADLLTGIDSTLREQI